MSRLKKPRICLIYTGGTIGMRRLPNGVLRSPEDPTTFLKISPEMSEIVNFDFVPLMTKDSTNINPNDWTVIAKAIYERRHDGYDGFLVAHGTDTMHFSASAVAFSLGKNLNFPVVFTGAQTIPEIHHGDARVNLLRACKVAGTTDIAEVVISFGDYVFRGCRAQKKDERRFDAFESPACPPLAFITEEIIPHAWAKSKNLATDREDIVLESEFSPGVLQVSLIPGLEPEMLLPTIESGICKGIILQSFGAGNVPNREPYSFMEFIQHAKQLNIPTIITSQFPANATLHTSYEPGRDAIAAGAIPTGNMTASCAAAKFRWVLAKVDKMIASKEIDQNKKIPKVNEIMQTVFINEMDISGEPLES
jgi:L-asparaginase type I